jgi:hypothetical protein
VFFEQVIRDNLDVGRPDQVTLVFGRRLMRRGPRATPRRFRTRVITEGVTPSLHVDYKHTTIKQYHKEGRALRTETTINDTRDFHLGISGGLHSGGPALRPEGQERSKEVDQIRDAGEIYRHISLLPRRWCRNLDLHPCRALVLSTLIERLCNSGGAAGTKFLSRSDPHLRDAATTADSSRIGVSLIHINLEVGQRNT